MPEGPEVKRIKKDSKESFHFDFLYYRPRSFNNEPKDFMSLKTDFFKAS